MKTMLELTTPFCTALAKRAAAIAYDTDVMGQPYCAYFKFPAEPAGTPCVVVEDEHACFVLFDSDATDAESNEEYNIHYPSTVLAFIADAKRTCTRFSISPALIDALLAAYTEAFPK